MAERVFIAICLTAFCIWLFWIDIPEAFAAGLFIALFAFYIWCDIFREIDKKRESKLHP